MQTSGSVSLGGMRAVRNRVYMKQNSIVWKTHISMNLTSVWYASFHYLRQKGGVLMVPLATSSFITGMVGQCQRGSGPAQPS